MGLRINNNIASINGHRNMQKADHAISMSLEKLSSGMRINRAADDAAGLVISEQMRAQITGLNQAVDNSETAVSMVQTAEGALDEMSSLLNKARELALHAANTGVNDTNQLAADQSEIDNIVGAIDRIANNTQFGTKKLLDGTLSDSKINNASVVSFQQAGMANATYTVAVTAGVLASISYAATNANATLTNATTASGLTGGSTWDSTTTLTVGGVSVSAATGTTVSSAIQSLNTALTAANAGYTVSMADGVAGASEAQLVVKANDAGIYANTQTLVIANGTGTITSSALANGTNAAVASIDGQAFTVTGNRGLTLTSTAGSSISVANNTTATLTNAVTVQDGAIFQVGANQGQTVKLSVGAARSTDIGTGAVAGLTLNSLKANSMLTSGATQNAITVVDKAIDQITNLRGKLGAFQANTLESGLNSLRTTKENLTAAESTIRDVDFAAESARFTRNQIMIQASTAMLAQANQLPQNVLQLLRG